MRVTSGRGFAADLSVTSDGKHLALRRREYRGGVYLADVKEGGRRLGTPKRLTLDEREDFPGSWTPDSKAVIFYSDRDGPRRIFKQSIDQTQPELLGDAGDAEIEPGRDRGAVYRNAEAWPALSKFANYASATGRRAGAGGARSALHFESAVRSAPFNLVHLHSAGT